MSRYIVIEGYECTGKSSLLDKLKAKYAGHPDVVFVREPGGTKEGEAIRSLIFQEGHEGLDSKTVFCLMQAARIELHEKVVKPALEAGKVVISDRSFISSLLYQTARDTSLAEKDFLSRVIGYNTILTYTDTYKKATILHLEASKSVLGKRLEERGKDNHFDSLEFYDRYLEVLKVVKGFYSVQSMVNETLNDQKLNLEYIVEYLDGKLRYMGR